MNMPTTKLNMSSLIAGGVVITVAMVIISSFALRSLGAKLGENNQVLSKKRAASSQLSDNIDSLANLSEQYAALGDKKILIQDALPTSANFPAIVSMMEELSKNAGVKLLSLAPGTVTQSGTSQAGPVAYEYSASINGGYGSFKEFLKNVELSLRPLAITNMKISGTSSLLGVDMEISTYYQSEYDTSLKTVPLKQSTGKSSKSQGEVK